VAKVTAVANRNAENLDIFLGQGFKVAYELPGGDVILAKGRKRVLYDTRRDKPIVDYDSNLNA